MEYLLFALAGAFLLMVLAQLMVKKKRRIHYVAIIAFLSLSYVLSYFAAVEAGFIDRFPALYFSDISISFLIAPAAYLFFSDLLSEESVHSRLYLWHFALPAVIFIGFAVYNGMRATDIPGLPFDPGARFSHPALFLFSLSGDLYLFGYNTLAFIRGILLYRRGAIKKNIPYRIVMCIILFYESTICVLLMNYVIRVESIFSIGGVASGSIILIFTLISLRMVDYKSGMNKITSYPGERGDTSWDEDLEEIMRAVRCYLEEKQRYLDPSYQLKSLSRDVGRPVAQVSYTINRVLGMSFRAYLNNLRIEAAARDLLEKTDESILTIAMENGFNSKSSFNTLFRERFGMPPREYRNIKIGVR